VVLIRIEFYDDIAKPSMQPVITQFLNVAVNGKKVLVIDDVSDSGLSLKIAKQYLIEEGAVEIKIATLYVKALSQTMPDFVEKITARWIVFPWEIKETLQSIFQKQKGNPEGVTNEFNKLLKAGLSEQLFEQVFKILPES